jgi:hypothetical protein
MGLWALRRLCKTYDKMKIPAGEVAEWSIASDLKSDEAQASESSNLSLSVKLWLRKALIPFDKLRASPQPLLPSLGEGEPELKAKSPAPSPKLGRGLG